MMNGIVRIVALDPPSPDPPSPGLHSTGRPPGAWPGDPVPGREALAAAQRLLAAVLPPTPLVRSEPLSRQYGREILLKMELLSPIRSFKHRGALVAVDRIARERPGAPIFTASTGNHGQGVAYAANRVGLPVTVHSPTTAAAVKLAAMRGLGATVVVAGADLDAAQKASELAAESAGGVYIEDGENPDLMAGAATVVTEILDATPALDTLIVPVGGGNLIGGALLAVAASEREIDVVGVQSHAAPSATASWLAGRVIELPCATFAGGLATTRPGTVALEVMTAFLRRMIVVTEHDLDLAMAAMLVAHGVQLEGASASTLAALALHGDEIGGTTVGLLITGNWASPAEVERTVAIAASGPT